jgi:hypothetical protein
MGMLDGKKPADAAQNPKSLDEFLTGLFEQFSKWASKMVGGMKFDSLLNTGLLANVDITKAGIQVNNQILKQNFDVQGGTLANVLSEGTQIASVKDFSKIQVPPIEGLGIGAPERVSMADLGNFTPDFTPSRGPSMGGMEMA